LPCGADQHDRQGQSIAGLAARPWKRTCRREWNCADTGPWANI